VASDTSYTISPQTESKKSILQFLTTLQYDDAAITMWSNKFGTQTTVNVDDLCVAVFETLQEKVPEAGCKDVMICQKYNCLRTLVKDTSVTASPKKKSYRCINISIRITTELVWTL